MTATSPVNAIQYPDLTNVKDQVAQFATMNTNIDTSIVPRFVNAAERAAKITAPVAGQLAYLSTESILTYYDGTAWLTAESHKTIVKTNTEQITAATVAANNDDVLYFYAEANSVYVYDLCLAIIGDTAANAFTWLMAGPSGATLSRSMISVSAGESNVNSCQIRLGNSDAFVSSVTTGFHTVAATAFPLIEKGTIVTSSTPGLFYIQWSKPTAYATALQVLAGSYLTYRKIS